MSSLKKICSFILFFILVLSSVSCFHKTKKNSIERYNFNEKPVEETTIDPFDFDENYGSKKIAVVYFSATGNTKMVAEKFKSVLNADIIELVPTIPYTAEDLMLNSNARSSKEQKLLDLEDLINDSETIDEENETVADETNVDSDENAKETIAFPEYNKINIKKYDVIALGFPIWYSEAPRIVYRFVKEENLNNKIIIPFCTSGGSDIDVVEQQFSVINENATFMQGRRFDKDATEEEIKNYLVDIGTDLEIK